MTRKAPSTAVAPKLFSTGLKTADAFLAAYVACGNITAAAAAAGLTRDAHYWWMRELDGYADAFRRAELMSADVMEAEAYRRAVEGVDKPIYYKGQRVDTIKDYSDVLLIFKLKGAKPEKYKDHSADTYNTQVNVHADQMILSILEHRGKAE